MENLSLAQLGATENRLLEWECQVMLTIGAIICAASNVSVYLFICTKAPAKSYNLRL